jgi:hypothetical protein
LRQTLILELVSSAPEWRVAATNRSLQTIFDN